MGSTEKQRESMGARAMSFSNQERGASYKSANNSFSGADMVAVMSISGGRVKGSCVLGTLQTISVSTSMNRMPIRVIGNINAKDYVMGQRTIAGSLVFAVFDKHFMYEAIEEISGLSTTGNHFLADELPPFDITISFANEYGRAAKMAIYGVRLISEGQVMSINDVFTENTYQYVATDIDYINNYETNTSGDMPRNPSTSTDEKEYVTVTETISINDSNKKSEKDQRIYLTLTDSILRGDIEEGGMASIDVLDRTMYGNILINGNHDDQEFQVDVNSQFPIVCRLKSGNYKASFTSKSGNKGDDVNFEIKKIEIKKEAPLKPMLISSKKRDGTFDIYVAPQDSLVEKMEYSENDKVWNQADKGAYAYTISGIGENSICKIRAVNAGNVSDEIEIITNSRKEHMIDDFKMFMLNLSKPAAGERTYIDKVFDLAAEEESKDIPLLSTILGNINKKISLTDDKLVSAYSNIMCECVKYENMFARLKDDSSRVKAPRLIDIARSIIELSPETDVISIESDFTYNRSITKESFTRYNDKYIYELRLSSAGLYRITARDRSGKKSMPVNIYIPTQPHSLSMISEREIKDANLKREIAYSESKVSIFLSKKINNKDKYALISEINNDSKKRKVGVMDPSIEYMDEKEVVVLVNINPIYNGIAYLCILRSSDIGTDKNPSRILITNNKFEYSYYVAKDGLRKGERYSVWVEDDMSIISGTSGFVMGSKEFILSDIRFEEIKNAMKAELDTQENMDFISSTAEENINSQSYMYSQMIKYNIYSAPNNELRTLLINDSISAMHRAYFEITPVLNISELYYSSSSGSLSWTFASGKYTNVVVTAYKNEIATTFVYKTDSEVVLNEFQQESDYLCFFFCDDDLKYVSEMTTVDMVTKEAISPFEIGVI